MAGPTLPRRTILKGVGASLGLAACGDPADRATRPQGPGSIDTVVILMMENRSFDHVFGSLSLLEGRTDVDGLTPGLSNLDLDGREVFISELIEPCTEPDPPHGWSSSRTQLDGGTCGGFVRALQESRGIDVDTSIPMTFQTRLQQPISYALADEYALCQRWFSSVLSSTWPNRLYLHAASSEGIPGNTLPPEGLAMPALWDQLSEAGVDWAYYFTDLPTLALFTREAWLPRMLHIDKFYLDAAAGALPPVVCVDAGAAFNDDHPPHHPMLGQMFIASIYQALADSPHWDRCLFVVCYDEAGGFYDHVPPPKIDDDYADQGFDQLGFRVPAFLAGPYVRNTVSDTLFDHTAPMRLVQDLHGLPRLNARNRASQDLASLLDADALANQRPRPPIQLPTLERTEEEVEAECQGLGGRTGQPELRDLVRWWSPGQDRTADLPGTARRLWRRYADQGLWVPV